MTMSTVLIVEDEKHLADGLRFNLEGGRLSVEITGRRRRGLNCCWRTRKTYDVVVLT